MNYVTFSKMYGLFLCDTLRVIIIIILIAPMSIPTEDQLGDVECLYKARPAAITEAYSETLEYRVYMNEVKMNDRVKMNVRLKPLASQEASEPTRVGTNKTNEERIVQRETF